MEDYNRLISSRILDSYEDMLDHVPQPQMLGGKRVRNYVLPGSTDYDYPGTLSVGRMDNQVPQTLGGEFWKDFGRGFPVEGPKIEGGKINVGKAFKQVGRALKPVGKALKPVAEEAIKELKPVAKKYGKKLLKEGLKKGVDYLTKSQEEPMEMEGGKKFNFGKALGSVAKPIGKELLKQGVKKGVQMGVEALASGAGRRRKSKSKAMLEDLEGGALIKDHPEQYHSNVYPPALASYTASLPKGHDAYGRGRAKLPKSGAKRNSARGAIVAEVMRKKGLSLIEASKYVKNNNLY